MLQTIREYTQGWIAGVIITLVILSFALWGIHSYFVGGAVNTNVAVVNGTDITKDQLALAYDRLRRQTQFQYNSSENAAKIDAQIKDRALQNLINIEVLKQSASKQGFAIFDRQIDAYLENMPEFQVNGQFSIEKLQEVLSSNLLSTSEFLDIIRTSLLIEQPRLGVIASSFALPDEVNVMIELVNQERSFNYLPISLLSIASQPIVISSEKIKSYYDEHKSLFMTPEQISIDYVELSLNDLKANIDVNDSTLQSFYSDNANAYSEPMQWSFVILALPIPENASDTAIDSLKQNAVKLAEDLKSNADVKTIAKKYSAILTQKNALTLNQIAPELQKTIAILTKTDDVSAPIVLGTSIGVVKILNVSQPKIPSFDTVKDKVTAAYIKQRAEEKFASLREQLASITYEHPDSLQNASKTLNLPIKTSELFSQNKAGTDISQYKKIRDLAFSHEVKSMENNSDVIQLTPETAVVIRMKSHTDAKLLPLNDEMTKQIETTLKHVEAEHVLETFANQLKSELEAGANAETIATKYHLTWQSSGMLGRYSTKLDTAILDLAFRLPKPEANKNTIYGVVKVSTGYAIVNLNAIKSGAILDKKQYDIYAEQFQGSESLLEYQLYNQSQTKNANIKLM